MGRNVRKEDGKRRERKGREGNGRLRKVIYEKGVKIKIKEEGS